MGIAVAAPGTCATGAYPSFTSARAATIPAMRRSILLLAVLLAGLTLALSACGGDDAPDVDVPDVPDVSVPTDVDIDTGGDDANGDDGEDNDSDDLGDLDDDGGDGG